MHLILCLDPRNGMAFNGRRQSRDALQRERMLATVGGGKLFLRPDSAILFAELPANAEVTGCSSDTPKGAYFFAERAQDLPLASTVEQVIVYRWGREYPADEYVSLSEYIAGKRLLSRVEFAGSSHPAMTEEVYA